jgi:phosphocarrier protein HPr
MIDVTIIITNKLGLHARAAAKFVSHASHYASEINIIKDGQSVNGKSIMGVMLLAATQGTELQLVITGADETDMFNDLVQLIENKFGEPE